MKIISKIKKYFNYIQWGERYKKPEPLKKYSIANQLKLDGKITEEFEIMLNNLTMEELIGLKLELASKSFGGKLFGLPIWSCLLDITKDAVLIYTYSSAKTIREACTFIGVGPGKFKSLCWRYRTKDYFHEKERERKKKVLDK